MKYFFILITIVFLIIPCIIYAQTGTGYFGLYGSLSFPQGDFGDDDVNDDDCGFAKTGFGVGAEFTLPLGSPGLGWITSATFILNGFDEDELEDYVDEGKMDAGSWLNIPIMTGLRYESEVSPTMKIYGQGQVGLNLVKAPKIEFEYSYYDYYEDEYYSGKSETEWDIASSFGFAIGGGIIINNKINIGLRYFSLGEPEIEGKIKSSGESDKTEWELPISAMLITVGINFN
ncbi:MAG: outer membrane beta-barrel protein [Candidatus Helarchaeota archaeon]